MRSNSIARLPKFWAVILFAVGLSGCATTQQAPYHVNPDRMAGDFANSQEGDATPRSTVMDELEQRGFSRLTPLEVGDQTVTQQTNIAQTFTDRDQQTVTANELPIRQFIETVFGEALGVNYITTPEAEQAAGTITLNISEPISSRRLYTLTESLLADRNIEVTRREDVFYISQRDAAQREGTVIGFGRQRSNVPETIRPIMQIIPLRYGITVSIERTLNRLTDARLTIDHDQNAVFVEAARSEVLRVLDIVNLLDRPANRGKHVGLIELTYITADEFIEQVTALLQAEGIRTSTSASAGVSLLLVPVQQVGAVAAFSGEDFILQRMEFWATQIDRPSRGAEKRYYIYHPRYARAVDLGASIAPLLGESQSEGDMSRDTQSAQPQGRQLVAGSQPQSGRDSNQRQGNRNVSVHTEDLRMTVDERSNSIIFFTAGETYQSLLPIIRRLDVMPKQILLDATIAEVTMTDEFAQGFEFAFSEGEFSGGTLGSLGVSGMGGLALNWTDGIDRVLARLSASSSLVNVLSNPTLVVRDGVSASISVGNDIPTVGATTSDPIQSDRQTTVVNYRKTGVMLSVTPSINAQGLVVLEIDQQISNTSETAPSLGGSPAIFERSIQTEVIAQSGQTILLGGLISENTSNSNANVPGLSRIPILGHLFRGQSESSEKTELVIFITPRVIDSVDQWTDIRSSITQGLTNLKVAE